MSSTIVNHVWARLTAFTELLRVLMFLRKDDDHFFVVFSSSGSGFQVPLECCCPSYLFFHDFLCEVSAGLVWVNTRINRRIDGSLCWAWRVNNTLQLGKSIVRFAFSALTFVGRLRLCFVLSLLFLEIQLRADVLYRAPIDSKVVQPRSEARVLVRRHNIYLTIFYCLKSNLWGPSFATFVGQYRLFMCCTCEWFGHNQPITLLFTLLLTSRTFQCSATNWRHVSSCLDLPPQP